MAACALDKSALATRVSSSTSGSPFRTSWPLLTHARVITPARSERTGIHSIGSTLPFVFSELTRVSRVALVKFTSGGVVFFSATQITSPPATSRRIASQIRLALTNRTSRESVIGWQSPFSQNLFQDYQRVAGAHRLALSCTNLRHAARPAGFQLVLHFHRFHHHQALRGFHLIAFVHQHADHFAWHGRGHVLAPRSDGGA